MPDRSHRVNRPSDLAWLGELLSLSERKDSGYEHCIPTTFSVNLISFIGLINSAQFLGNLTGLPFTAFLSDTLGRRTALFIGSLFMCLGVGLQAAAWNVAMLIGARYTSQCSKTVSQILYLKELFIIGSWSRSLVLPERLTTPSHRAILPDTCTSHLLAFYSSCSSKAPSSGEK